MIGDFFNNILEEEDKLTKDTTDKVEEKKVEDTLEKEIEEIEEDLSPIEIIMQDIAAKELFPIDTEKEYTADEEGLYSLIQDGINNSVSQMFSEREDLSLLVDIVQSGGTVGELFERMNGVSYSDLDIEDEDTKRTIISDYYEARGLKADKIDKLIKDAIDSNSLEEEFTVAYNELVEREKQTQKNYLVELQTQKKLEAENADKELKALEKEIFSKEEIQGFKLDKKTKEQFYSYLTKLNKQGKTQLEIDSEDREKQLTMAWMYFTNFNKEDFTKQTTTTLTEKLKNKISGGKLKGISKASGSQGSKREVDDDPFANLVFPV